LANVPAPKITILSYHTQARIGKHTVECVGFLAEMLPAFLGVLHKSHKSQPFFMFAYTTIMPCKQVSRMQISKDFLKFWLKMRGAGWTLVKKDMVPLQPVRQCLKGPFSSLFSPPLLSRMLRH
jgi:hypothetical protein